MNIEQYKEMRKQAEAELAESIKETLSRYPDLIITDFLVDVADTFNSDHVKAGTKVHVTIISEI
jgi:hypothetical protein